MAVRDGYLRPVTTAMPDNSYSFVGLKILCLVHVVVMERNTIGG